MSKRVPTWVARATVVSKYSVGYRVENVGYRMCERLEFIARFLFERSNDEVILKRFKRYSKYSSVYFLITFNMTLFIFPV